ncbi:MAG: Flp pilus assembly protein CpaB [Bdellovibrionota bacterium]
MARQFGGMQSSRRSDGTRILVLIGLILFVLFSGTTFLLLQTEQAPQAPVVVEPDVVPMKLVTVLVPVREIEAGTALMPHMFRQEKRPEVGVSERAVTSYEELEGSFARSLIVPGQPLHKEYITTIRPANVLTAKIPEGFRAVTIRTDSLTSVGGFARPGARVDVNWSTRINGAPAIVPIVENAEVLSADSQTTNQQGTEGIVPNTVTLLVTAEDAKKIQLATSSGSLSLSLRGDNDTRGSDGRGDVTIQDLLGQPVVKEPVKNDGAVIVDGKKYYLVNGRLVAADSVN